VHRYKLDEEYERKLAEKKQNLGIDSMLQKYDKTIMVREFLF